MILRFARQIRCFSQPGNLYCLVYSYVDGMLEKRAPYRKEHLEILQNYEKQGLFKLAAVLDNPLDTALLVFTDADKAKEFVSKDPYKKNGLVTKWEVRKMNVAVGGFK